MPRQMGELRRLCLEWNSLVEIARRQGINVRPRAHFHMDRAVARQRVADLRAQVAPFFAPTLDADCPALTDTFGVEIECLVPIHVSYERLAEMIRAEGVLCMAEGYNHATRSHWKVTHDGSVYGRSLHGVEIVSPPLSGDEGFESIRKVCAVLVRVGAKVNRTCGLHVHVGCRDRGVGFFKTLVKMYKHFERQVDAFVAPSRRGYANTYCQPSTINPAAMEAATTVEQVGRASGQLSFGSPRSSCRYRKLNLMPYPVYGTVEFRQHQGTVESRKIEMWVRLCLRMVSAAGTSDAIPVEASEEAMFDRIGATQAERSYFTERRERLARRAILRNAA